MSNTKQHLLVLTNSADGTSDFLIELAKHTGSEIFRWNFDLWTSYVFEANEYGYSLEDNHNRRWNSNSENSIVLWRKPYAGPVTNEIQREDSEFLENSFRGLINSLIWWAKISNRLKLINPHAEAAFTKPIQMQIAKEFFRIPKWSASTINDFSLPDEVIVKALGNPVLPDFRMMYTTLVKQTELEAPYPWLRQNAIRNGKDVTCVYIDKSCYWYESDFVRTNDSLDWRTNIQTENESKWVSKSNYKIYDKDVISFMNKSKLLYGRLDFIFSGNELYFLEVNPNGQFGFLDSENLELHRNFLVAVLKQENSVN